MHSDQDRPAGQPRAERRRIDRRIAALAIPALGALVAEPLFLIVDSALVGHLGATPSPASPSRARCCRPPSA